MQTESIRYQRAECTDKTLIELFLRQARSGNLAFHDQEYPYTIPMAYIWYKGVFYMHGASEGKKNRLREQNNKVCFTINEDYGTVIGAIPADIGTAYMSVVVFGKVEILTDLDLATEVMNAMLDKYVPNYFQKPMKPEFLDKYRSSLGTRTVVWELKPLQMSAKRSAHDPMKLFFGGRTREMEIELGIK